MAEPSTVARPYAEAAFRLADSAGALAKWSEMLGILAAVGDDERVRAAVTDPKLNDAKAAGIFISILSGRLSAEAENFVRVLAENGRLALLPEIRAHFEALKNEREGVVEVEVQTAFELTEAQVVGVVDFGLGPQQALELPRFIPSGGRGAGPGPGTGRQLTVDIRSRRSSERAHTPSRSRRSRASPHAIKVEALQSEHAPN